MPDLEAVHNFYEKKVFDEINNHYRLLDLDEQQLADIACIALNSIQPKYICHEIDLAFFTSDQEQLEQSNIVESAVKSAYEKVAEN